MSDGVLPRRELLLVVGKLVADEIADATKGQFLHRALEDGHGYESDVGIRRLDGGGVFWSGRGGEAALALS